MGKLPDLIYKPLTLMSTAGGCAAKIGPNELNRIVSGLKIDDTNSLSVLERNDDAGYWRLSDDLLIVQSVDIITPISDDPYVFGGIAAAHALSDLYAKGASPLLGLLMLNIPVLEVSPETGHKILQGAIDKLLEAGAGFMGGHTMGGCQLEFGLAVTGLMHGDIVQNNGCKEGDVLILTKRLGTGIITTALKLKNAQVPIKEFSLEAVAESEKSMLELNNVPSEVMMRVGVHACTDISGFGLVGHLSEMLSKDNLSAIVQWNAIPVFSAALSFAKQMISSAGGDRNAAFWWDRCKFADDLTHENITILFDPQTSGGLLISVAPEKADLVLEGLSSEGVENCAAIGHITRHNDRSIVIET